jgi:hypothetical protein
MRRKNEKQEAGFWAQLQKACRYHVACFNEKIFLRGFLAGPLATRQFRALFAVFPAKTSHLPSV